MVTRRVGALISALLLVGVMAACGGDDTPTAGGGAGQQEQPPATPVKIRMGWGIPAEEIKYVMMAKPELARNMGTWYTVEWHQFAGTTPGVQGLAAGTLDGATVGSLSVANGLDQDADIVITGEFIEERSPGFSTAWLVKKDSPIQTVADMRGKVMGSSAIGGSTDYIAKFKLRNDAKLEDGKDYKTEQVSFAQMQEALSAGRIDMGNFAQPFFARAMAAGEFRVV